jgi:hypothetical protein
VSAQDPAVQLELRGEIEVKGKGQMQTFWIPDQVSQNCCQAIIFGLFCHFHSCKHKVLYLMYFCDQDLPPLIVTSAFTAAAASIADTTIVFTH